MQSLTALVPVPTVTVAPPLKRTNNNAISKYTWTEEKVAKLHHFTGLGSASPSMREIAVELFGTEYARSAVAGKMFRLGLCKKITDIQRATQRSTPQRVKKSNYNHGPRFGPQPEEESTLVRVFRDIDIQDIMPSNTSFLCTLDQLKPSMCRAPIGDPQSPDFRFCGDPDCMTPGPYCNFHYRMFYVTGTTQSGSVPERYRVGKSEPKFKVVDGKMTYDD